MSCKKSRRRGTRTDFAFVAEEVGKGDRRSRELDNDIYRHFGTMEHASDPVWKCHRASSFWSDHSWNFWTPFGDYTDFISPVWSATPGKVDHSPSENEAKYNRELGSKTPKAREGNNAESESSAECTIRGEQQSCERKKSEMVAPLRPTTSAASRTGARRGRRRSRTGSSSGRYTVKESTATSLYQVNIRRPEWKQQSFVQTPHYKNLR